MKSFTVTRLLVFGFALFLSLFATGQTPHSMTRLARLVIDSSQLESYKAMLREEIQTSLRVEPGVLTLYPVWEKDHPNHITILEIYADTAAYQAHLKTQHFIKYKTGTKDMVQSLELVSVIPLLEGIKKE